MSTPLIETNVPLPHRRHRSKEKYGYVDEMNIGDSIFFINETRQTLSALMGAIAYRSRTDGKKFATRTMDGGLRIWRLK